MRAHSTISMWMARSKAMWNSVKQYICDAAGISCNVIESRGPRDFEKVVSEMDLTHVSGIVVCGGDGTAHEVLQVAALEPWQSVLHTLLCCWCADTSLL